MNPVSQPPPAAEGALSRRVFLQSSGAAAGIGGAALAAPSPADAAAGDPPPGAPAAAPGSASTLREVRLRVNGQDRRLRIEPRVTLLDALRENLGMPGTKKGCDRGQCGACTVLADGRRINACLSLAVMQEGVEIVTVEGLGTPNALHPVQAAFLAHDAFQCGYCTPGQICSTVALLQELRAGVPSAATADIRAVGASAAPPGDDEIRERLSGNLCRCGAYSNIVAAVRALTAGGAA